MRIRLQLLVTLAISACFLSLAGCGTRQTPPAPDNTLGMVADLTVLPQDLTVYAARAGMERRLLDAEAQARQNARYDKLFFAPWDAARPSVKAEDAFAIFGLKAESRPRGWAENLLPWSARNWAKLAANANRHAYPSRLDKAITVAPTPLREAPTHQPRFGNPLSAGEGFPFDLFMYATLPTGMPLLVTHASADGAWLFVENALVAGWVPADNVAVTDEAFRSRYRNGYRAAILRDNVPLRDASGGFRGTAGLGALLPLERTMPSGFVLLAPCRNAQGRATLVPVQVSREDAAPKPLPVTPEALARIGNRLMGQPYGWGGLYGNRDCSMLLRDLFTPFGIWLPRNSAAQARTWEYVDFANKDTAAKEQYILDEGEPFATLLWLKGHIALYVGAYDGKAVMFHSLWGIRTEQNGQEGRHVIGRAVVTTTRPGVELPFVQDREGLLNRMRGMSRLR